MEVGVKARAPFGLDASRGVSLAGVAAAVVLTLVVNVLVVVLPLFLTTRAVDAWRWG